MGTTSTRHWHAKSAADGRRPREGRYDVPTMNELRAPRPEDTWAATISNRTF